MIHPTNFRVFTKVLIINNSAIIWICSKTLQTSSELIWTRSELISTRSELIFRIAEQIAFAPHSTLRWAAESGDLRGVLLTGVYLSGGDTFNIRDCAIVGRWFSSCGSKKLCATLPLRTTACWRLNVRTKKPRSVKLRAWLSGASGVKVCRHTEVWRLFVANE